jgi:DNA-binding transcriptional regulator YdaS (Cro superfamily)
VKNNKPYQALLETEQGRALYDLIEHMDGIQRIVLRLGVEPYILNNWVHIWKQVSPDGALQIQENIGGRFTKEFMRPDITDWESALKPKRNWFDDMRKTSQGRALIAIIQKAGGRSGFAAIMGVQPNIVDCWVQRGCVPVSRAAEIADKMGMDVASVRPDKFEGVCP